jgi:hypothetical protein
MKIQKNLVLPNIAWTVKSSARHMQTLKTTFNLPVCHKNLKNCFCTLWKLLISDIACQVKLFTQVRLPGRIPVAVKLCFSFKSG